MKHTIIFLFLLCFARQAAGQLYKYEAENLCIVYAGKSYSYLIPHVSRSFINAFRFHQKFWNYNPAEPVTIFMNDFSDYGTAGTMTIPFNFISLNISPFEYTYDVMPANERMQWLMSHELTHTVMTDKASSEDNFFRSLFIGKVTPEPSNPLSMFYSYLTIPRWYSPRWFHEGIAVFMETWMSGGLGRVLGGYDEMVFRAMAKDSAYFYRVIGLETEGTTIDFQVGVNSYLYGTRFVTYLASAYGTQKLVEFYSRTDSSSMFYAPQFQKVYGIPVKEAWDNWITAEIEFQKANLELVKKYPLTHSKQVISFPLGSVSKSFYDSKSRKVYAAVNYPGSMSKIISYKLDTGEISTIADAPSPMLYCVTSLAYDCDDDKLFYSTHNSDWRGLNEIKLPQMENNELIEYTRTGDFAFNRADKSLWGIQHMDGKVNLVRIPSPYNNIEYLYTIPYGKSFFDLDISPDGKLLSGTLSDVTGKQELVLMKTDSVMEGNPAFEKAYEFEDNSASNFTFSLDNNYLFGTSYYTGVSNVYRINLQTKKADLITNTDIGYFRPLQLSSDTLLVYEYTTNGLKPCLISINPLEDAQAIKYLGQTVLEKDPEVESWILPPPSKINLDSIPQAEGRYNPLNNLRFVSMYPLISGYKDFLSYGLRFNFIDHIGLNSLDLTLGYTPVKLIPQKQRLHIMLNYRYWDWEVKAGLNKTDFYDIFGPTKTSRAGYYYSLKYVNDIIFMKPERMGYYVLAAAYGDLEKLPGYQNINASFNRLYSLEFNFNYSYLRKSLGAVEDEQGINLNIYESNDLVNKKVFPKVFSTADFGLLLPVRNSSLWFRTAAGYSFGERGNTFSNFYFGGFGNNYIDYKNAQRYREMESYPGLEINETGGTNFLKGTLEWNITPLRFRNAGLLYLYSTYARLSLFTSVIALNIDKSSLIQRFYSAGSQLDIELVLFSLMKTTLSLGYAKAFSRGRAPSDEFMISFKIM